MVVVDGPDDCNQRLENPHLEPLVVAEAKDGVELAGALLLRQAARPLRRHHWVSLEPIVCSAITGTHFLGARNPLGRSGPH